MLMGPSKGSRASRARILGRKQTAQRRAIRSGFVPCPRVITGSLPKDAYRMRRRVRLRTSRAGPGLDAFILSRVSAPLSDDSTSRNVGRRDLTCWTVQVLRGLVDRRVDERRAASTKQ